LRLGAEAGLTIIAKRTYVQSIFNVRLMRFLFLRFVWNGALVRSQTIIAISVIRYLKLRNKIIVSYFN
jgi:hypothetical protein